ncbi:pseudouridine synthase [Alkalibacillus haloalkaliphilus]|uniref:Pseudouridine synthase n=1 Tax=Alkalibacillus haloalkaliphilus TaxID=94136 RepID=A0A511W344_9BACI|nr:pseudouridine synthase [Alkalibacillus haloalkaliphilus]MDV2580862.1 pseudouridine synthase [Alkalibacillus haloalkaliphilus]GEN45191.1 pseudouridine synthase [Alkalibacillus haloalkaliphilus]
MSKQKERLQKVIAKSGITSRRKAEGLIESGRVKVNGKVVTELGTKVGQGDEVAVDDIIVEKEQPVYFMVNKPRQVLSTVEDDKGRKVVTDLLPDEIEQRVYPVGRLDYDTTGILILTNDGNLTNKLIHPKFEVDKVYVAKVNGELSREEALQLKKGVIHDGERLKAVKTRIIEVDKKKKKTMIEMVLHQGKNRQVRRMFEALGYRVDKLKRERFGTLALGNLQPGQYRELTPHEVKQLADITQKNVK